MTRDKRMGYGMALGVKVRKEEICEESTQKIEKILFGTALIEAAIYHQKTPVFISKNIISYNDPGWTQKSTLSILGFKPA